MEDETGDEAENAESEACDDDFVLPPKPSIAKVSEALQVLRDFHIHEWTPIENEMAIECLSEHIRALRMERQRETRITDYFKRF
jgi:hypothetical protein